MSQNKPDSGSLRDLWRVLSQNRVGLIGFGLSLLQLMVHGAWLIGITLLTRWGVAEQLQSGDWELWLIAALMIIGAVLTAVSLFMCLYGTLHGKPKVLALIGLAVSFFVGALTTFVLLFNALTNGPPGT